jgi:hypothetical protein
MKSPPLEALREEFADIDKSAIQLRNEARREMQREAGE